MYAASGWLGKRATFALLALIPVVTAGCTNGGSDNPTLPPSATTAPTSVSTGPAGPSVSIARVSGIPVPQLAGHTVANATLRAIGASFHGTCQVTTLRDDPKLASFQWQCRPGGVTTATFSLADDRRLALGDVLSGGYAAYLSSTAAVQLQAQGVTNPATSDLSRWSLTPYALQIVFPGGAVAFPITSLGRYIRDRALLKA